MNFQNKNVSILSLLVVSPMVFAGPPVAYDEWSVIGGKIDTSVSCATTGVTCNTIVSDVGMLYQEVATGGGKYLRLIITEKDATGDPNAPVGDADALAFSDESFVPFSLYDANNNPTDPFPTSYNTFAAPQGIADKQSIKDTTDNFVATTEVQRSNMRQNVAGAYGAASVDDMFTVKIDQSFSNAEISSDFSHTGYTQFANGFSISGIDPITGQAYSYVVAEPDTNFKIGSKTDIAQTLDISDSTMTGVQNFVYRDRRGYKGTTVPISYGSNYLVSAPLVTAGEMSVNAGNPVDWANGDYISTTWVVEATSQSDLVLGSAISYQNVKNITTGLEDSALIFDQPTGTVTPITWDANFGTEPSF